PEDLLGSGGGHFQGAQALHRLGEAQALVEQLQLQQVGPELPHLERRRRIERRGLTQSLHRHSRSGRRGGRRTRGRGSAGGRVRQGNGRGGRLRGGPGRIGGGR